MTTHLIHRLGPDLQREMERAVASPVQLLHDMLAFQISGRATGDLPRGRLCLIICNGLSGDYRRALPAAAAVELAHQRFAVHRGIAVTGNQRATGENRIEGRWGSGQAINAGDGLHAMARLSLARLQEHGFDDQTVLAALRLLDAACARTCEGLHIELAHANGQQDLAGILSLAEMKTGSLMGCAAQLGVLTAGGDDYAQQLAHQCGSHLGVALQIRKNSGTPHDHQSDLESTARHKMSRAKHLLDQLCVGEATITQVEQLLDDSSGPGDGLA